MATLQVRIDDNTKAAADSLFSGLGLDTSTAVRMFIYASLKNHGLPFDVRHHVPQLRSAFEHSNAVGTPVKLGGWEGMITMSDDFDAPLDDFEEYM